MKYRKEIMQIHRLAVPILMNYALTSVFEIFDEMIIGHYSVESFAFVGVASSILYTITGAFGSLSAAFHILAAELYGMQEYGKMEQTFAAAKLLATGIGGGFILAGLLGGRWFFGNIYTFSGQDLEELLSYFYPASITVLQNLIWFQYSVYFRNRYGTKIGVYATGLSVIVNLFFDIVLVYGKAGFPRMGVEGAAWGSVIGLACGLLVYQIAYYRVRCARMGSIQEAIKNILCKYPALFGQELFENTIFVLIVQGTAARLGTEHMAVYKLVDIVSGMLSLPVVAYASAAQTCALQSRAAGNKKETKIYLKAGQCVAFRVTGILCLLCGVFRKEVLGSVVTDQGVMEMAVPFLYLMFVLTLIRIPYQVYLTYLQGSGLERQVFLCTAVGALLAGSAVFCVGIRVGLAGIYLVMIAETVILAWIYGKQIRRKAERNMIEY